MIHAFRQVRLTNSLLTVTGDTRLQVGNRQVVYTDETGSFGNGASAGVASINGLTGALTASGYGDITVTTNGNILQISGNNSSLNTWTGNQQSFYTSISPTGNDTYFIEFPFSFSSAPKVVASVEITGDVLYSIAIRNRTVSGYSVIFSDYIAESGVGVHTIATIN